MGIKHLTLLKKPDAFQLGTDDPDDPKVQKTISQLGVTKLAKIPKPMHLVLAQLALQIRTWRFRAITCFRVIFTA